MSVLQRLIQEIHRRSLWQVLGIYVVASWVVLQAVELLAEAASLPEWFLPFALALLLIGLPIVLATAFVQEGLRPPPRGEPESRESGAPEPSDRSGPRRPGPLRRLFTWRNALVGGLLAFALWGVVATAWLLLREPAVEAAGERKMLAVLPFDNLGPDEDEYFADGLTEEIMARLAGISGLGVIARTSIMQYKGTDKPIPEIGDELGVDYILEGTVRWEHVPDGPSRIRVTPQLIRVADATHLWAEIYEEPLSGVFRVQARIAERVAEALDIALLAPQRRSLRAAPTENVEAYDYYLRGQNYYRRSYLEQDFRIAIRMYERAVELDPRFAVAHAKLSEAHSRMYWFYFDRSEERLSRAKKAVDRALALDPDLPEAHQALGYYHYWVHLDYDRAVKEFESALERQPNNSRVLAGIAYVRRRQGRFEEAADRLTRSVELDPRSPVQAFDLAQTYRLLRDYPTAEREFDRAIALSPDWSAPYSSKARLHLGSNADTRKARAVLARFAEIGGPSNEPGLVRSRFMIELLDGRYGEALGALSSRTRDVLEGQFFILPKTLLRAQVYALMDQPERARAAYDSARVILEARLSEQPGDSRAHSALGIAYAGLGRTDRAIREGRLGVELMPVSREAWKGVWRLEDLARIYTMVGEHEKAIDQLEFLLSRPGELSVALLERDPAWNPIREDPRFQALLDHYE